MNPFAINQLLITTLHFPISNGRVQVRLAELSLDTVLRKSGLGTSPSTTKESHPATLPQVSESPLVGCPESVVAFLSGTWREAKQHRESPISPMAQSNNKETPPVKTRVFLSLPQSALENSSMVGSVLLTCV